MENLAETVEAGSTDSMRSSLSLSLSALRTFEAVVRLGGLAPAAGELGMTVSAVSHQLKGLEHAIGRPLLQKEGRRSIATPAGASLASALTLPFKSIDAAVRDLYATRPVLTVSVHESFAAQWLLPRLRGFADHHPDLDIRLATTTRLVDLERERIDCAVRLGPGGWPDVDSLNLGAQFVAPLVRVDKFQLPLTRVVQDGKDADWDGWSGLPKFGRTLVLQSRDLVIDAVLAGGGSGVVDCIVLGDRVASGELVALASPRATDWSYFALTSLRSRSRREVRFFVEWLRLEMARDLQGCRVETDGNAKHQAEKSKNFSWRL